MSYSMPPPKTLNPFNINIVNNAHTNNNINQKIKFDINKIKIYFTSRTHSQLTQRTKFNNGSRKQLCVNDAINNDKCKELKEVDECDYNISGWSSIERKY